VRLCGTLHLRIRILNLRDETGDLGVGLIELVRQLGNLQVVSLGCLGRGLVKIGIKARDLPLVFGLDPLDLLGVLLLERLGRLPRRTIETIGFTTTARNLLLKSDG
jgi:hypothetical protein